MRYEIVLSREALHDLKRLRASIRSAVKKALEMHLRHDPTRVSRSRIKRLRGLSQPQYRLRVDDVRVFYDVSEDQVQILAIVSKADAGNWLADIGKPL